MTQSIDIRVLKPGDAAVLDRVGPEVFDDPIDPDATREFLADPRHHIAVAIDQGVVVGFASAVHYVHPDKPRPELWINEVSVAPTHLRRGLGKAVVDALVGVARQLGCSEAWVLTSRANTAAVRLYTAAGGVEDSSESLMFTFFLDQGRGS